MDEAVHSMELVGRSSPKAAQPNADSERESVKFGRAHPRPTFEIATMSTKTTKRKRASAPVTDDASARPTAAPAAETKVAPAVVTGPAAAVVAEPAQDIGPTIGLASNCTVKDAAALKNELLQLLDEPGTVAIDAKSVERIDTAIIQLLCAFVRDRSQRNSGVTWVGAPQPLLDAARLLGVGAQLSLPKEATP